VKKMWGGIASSLSSAVTSLDQVIHLVMASAS